MPFLFNHLVQGQRRKDIPSNCYHTLRKESNARIKEWPRAECWVVLVNHGITLPPGRPHQLCRGQAAHPLLVAYTGSMKYIVMEPCSRVTNPCFDNSAWQVNHPNLSQILGNKLLLLLFIRLIVIIFLAFKSYHVKLIACV